MGTTVGIVLISYDVDKSHVEVKNQMIKKGYSTSWKYPATKDYILPNTTLWHESKSSNQAIADITAVCQSLGVKLEKAFAALAREFAGI